MHEVPQRQAARRKDLILRARSTASPPGGRGKDPTFRARSIASPPGDAGATVRDFGKCGAIARDAGKRAGVSGSVRVSLFPIDNLTIAALS